MHFLDKYLLMLIIMRFEFTIISRTFKSFKCDLFRKPQKHLITDLRSP